MEATRREFSPRRPRPAPPPFRLPPAPTREVLVSKYFRALGEPTRLRILHALRDEGELTVGELARRLGVQQPKISHHLACLRWCGFVSARRAHRLVYSRLACDRVATLVELGDELAADRFRLKPGPHGQPSRAAGRARS